MPFIPHTDSEVKEMLATIGVKQVDDLFSEIPDSLKVNSIEGIPAGCSEMELKKIMSTISEKDKCSLNFIGAGSYEHHIPAAIWDVASRGEYLTSYTPYQAEVSQGTLQLIYEYQTMLSRLMSSEVSNASLYDGSTALAEAVLMAVRLSKGKRKKILMPVTANSNYRKVVKTLVHEQNIEVINVPYEENTGDTSTNKLDSIVSGDSSEIAALVIAQPNFFGVIEDADSLSSWAHKHGILVVALVNPLAMALLKAPGDWGDTGADIICGEGQPFGIPMASGGPCCGFMSCKKKYVRQLPGRIVGRTKDINGKEGYVLTLQAREQHIRRGKATSNICTNQGLLVVAMTMYMSILGFDGIQAVAKSSHHNTLTLIKLLQAQGLKPKFNSTHFHEVAIVCSKPVDKIKAYLAEHDGIEAGFSLGQNYKELSDCLLCCVTETKTYEEIEIFVNKLNLAIQKC